MGPKHSALSTSRDVEPRNPGRRRLLVAGSACAASLVLPNALAQTGSCVVTPDSGEGPFYFDPSLMRSDVTSGRMGAPLDVAVQITRLRNCAPFAGVRFDLWQADALGLYRSEEHTSELQSQSILVCRLLLEQKYKFPATDTHTVDIT